MCRVIHVSSFRVRFGDELIQAARVDYCRNHFAYCSKADTVPSRPSTMIMKSLRVLQRLKLPHGLLLIVWVILDSVMESVIDLTNHVHSLNLVKCSLGTGALDVRV